MQHFGFERLRELLEHHAPPCVSIYQPTHRHHPDNEQDPIRYRNLVREAEKRLREAFDGPEVDAIVERLERQGQDRAFWNHRTDGLAVLASPERFALVELQRSVTERVVVSDSFHVKPLVRALQSADRFTLLALTRHEARVFEGNRYALDEIELPDVPLTLTEALGEERSEPHLTVASYGMKGGGAGDAAMHHGHGGRDDEVDTDTERFFRHVDRAVSEHVSKPTGLPLLLVALKEHHTPFREVSHNAFLLEGGVEGNPEAFDLDTLRTKAWSALEPFYLGRLAELSDRFGSARARDQASDDVKEVARAATQGRVKVLLVEADRQIPGRVGASSGAVEPGGASRTDASDVLDDIAEAVLRTGGEVVVVPAERMPVETGVAAIYRY
ncbi:MAG: hypothetical protein EA416_17185 [Trueperaceae bacterium]|nr:MAG: hypothetical protein EA416_17185 [Trueperaceae bacterium]